MIRTLSPMLEDSPSPITLFLQEKMEIPEADESLWRRSEGPLPSSVALD